MTFQRRTHEDARALYNRIFSAFVLEKELTDQMDQLRVHGTPQFYDDQKWKKNSEVKKKK